jgi:hypothetical protein
MNQTNQRKIRRRRASPRKDRYCFTGFNLPAGAQKCNGKQPLMMSHARRDRREEHTENCPRVLSRTAESFRPTRNAFGVAEIEGRYPRRVRAKCDGVRGILSENSERARRSVGSSSASFSSVPSAGSSDRRERA